MCTNAQNVANNLVDPWTSYSKSVDTLGVLKTQLRPFELGYTTQHHAILPAGKEAGIHLGKELFGWQGNDLRVI